MGASDIDIIKQLTNTLERMQVPLPVEIDLWDVEAIARYLKRSYSTVRDHIIVQPSFPKAIRLPGKGRSYPLYKAREVIAWAESHQSKT